ncbi:ATP-dependent nuclease [Yersinia ruckeri]|uniref:ATP-dependent nuclease n=1 Tax=Yersinia ruckeri TaxID=29486 RepID=UPI0020C10E0A|nr:AAA family ATPase [Yersinia ruckeri]MCW6525934.1 AAA family ATPase [Yersinia ruckeri]MCW6560747.1 AAA family ATPase [Yersinia ruckeri]UZY03563.1 AAA family ATPase [Yersinia ruckeri]
MRLQQFNIKNYKSIKDEIEIYIDDIVVLIGPNNSGKSTILDAYEKFASLGSSKGLTLHDFYNSDTSIPIEMCGIFTDVTDADIRTLGGDKWFYKDDVLDRRNMARKYGGDWEKKHIPLESKHYYCVKWIWSDPEKPAQKQSYGLDETSGERVFSDGGSGGLDTLLQSRVPQPIRISPDKSMDETKKIIISFLKEDAKDELLKTGESKAEIIQKIQDLTDTLMKDSKSKIDGLLKQVSESSSSVFPGLELELNILSKDPVDADVMVSDSNLTVKMDGVSSSLLENQGHGVRRSVLWSALQILTHESHTRDKIKKAKGKPVSVEKKQYILLIDEPESFLHPPVIRDARESLYNFASQNENWQVMATTHSPVFIDLSKKHTTIIRIEKDKSLNKTISTDELSFSDEEKNNMKMIRLCNPMVNEFFFYDNIILVEGPTEKIVINKICEVVGVDYHIIDCLGKGNIKTFAKILNHFDVCYIAVHDSDIPKCIKKGSVSGNGAWGTNVSIMNECVKSKKPMVFIQIPHFEGMFLGDFNPSNKVETVISILSDNSSPEYGAILEKYSKVLDRDPSIFIKSNEEMLHMYHAFYDSNKAQIEALKNPEIWSI